MAKNLPSSAGDAGDVGSIPGLGRSPGIGNANPLHYSFLEISMDWGAWRATQFMGLQSQAPLSTGTDTRSGSAKLFSLSVRVRGGSGRADCLENRGLQVAASQV